MANLTIAVDDDLLRRARIRAAENDTSVNAVLRSELERFAGPADIDVAAGLRALAHLVPDQSGRTGRDWTRVGLYEERMQKLGG